MTPFLNIHIPNEEVDLSITFVADSLSSNLTYPISKWYVAVAELVPPYSRIFHARASYASSASFIFLPAI